MFFVVMGKGQAEVFPNQIEGVVIMLENLQAVMAEALNLEKGAITAEASLKDDLGIDSLDAVELIMELEDAFDIRIDEEQAQKLKKVSDIMALLEPAA